VDAIGGEREARAWLAEAHNIPADLRIRDIDARSRAERALAAGSELFWQGAASLLRAEGWMPGQISPR
jgi:protease-4